MRLRNPESAGLRSLVPSWQDPHQFGRHRFHPNGLFPRPRRQRGGGKRHSRCVTARHGLRVALGLRNDEWSAEDFLFSIFYVRFTPKIHKARTAGSQYGLLTRAEDRGCRSIVFIIAANFIPFTWASRGEGTAQNTPETNSGSQSGRRWTVGHSCRNRPPAASGSWPGLGCSADC